MALTGIETAAENPCVDWMSDMNPRITGMTAGAPVVIVSTADNPRDTAKTCSEDGMTAAYLPGTPEVEMSAVETAGTYLVHLLVRTAVNV